MFKQARERHLPKATLDQRSQQADSQLSAPSPPLATLSLILVRTTRSSQSIPIPRTSVPTDSSASQNKPTVSEEQTTESDDAATDGTSESQKHFLTNINLAWQKLNTYFNKTDATPIYYAAVVLHPRLK
jgi:hypothetical protein